MRVIDAEGKNVGVITLGQALRLAEAVGLDLIEISPGAVPPVAKIMDFGKFQYLANKKQKLSRQRAQTTETKGLQVKIGTGEHDLAIKAKKAAEFLAEGHRVKVDLFLRGRAKYLNENFLRGRLDRFLNFINLEYKIADPPKKSPKGLTVIIEKAK